MRKNITLSADEALIQQARWLAASEKTTLNQLFREWLTRYIAQANAPEEYEQLMEGLNHIQAGGHFSREEMNERR
ncbi:MAG: hypothetical protein KDE48_00265 [Anaerolineales bacterium]|nr:hypothetical protein [Anaerolineales bacterium]